MADKEYAPQAVVTDFVRKIRAMPAPALAGMAEEITGMVARGDVSRDFAIWAELALGRLDELALKQQGAARTG